MTHILEFDDVSYRYPNAEKWALAHASVAIEPGSFVVLAGPTGSGKSTLLKLARGLSGEYAGEFAGTIRLAGRDLDSQDARSLGSQVAIVFQNPAYQLHQLRVIDEIMSSLIYRAYPWQEAVSKASRTAEALGLDTILDHSPVELSSGQQQRVALAASIAQDADLILLDEPFAYLDATASQGFLDLLRVLKSQGKTIVLATHDLEPVAALADEIVVVSEGAIVDHGPPKVVLYGREYLDKLGCSLYARALVALFSTCAPEDRPCDWVDVAERVSGSIRMPSSLRSRSVEPGTDHSVIELAGVSFAYNEDVEALREIALRVSAGEVLGIIGRNGSGKTTLAKAIMGINKASQGTITILGAPVQNVRDAAGRAGLVMQNPSDMLFETTVLRECAFGPTALNHAEPVERARNALQQMGLLENCGRDPRSLSGGQQRLLTIADVLATDAGVVILDEPEFGLDPCTFLSVERAIDKLRSSGRSVVIITHRLEAATCLCDRVAVMSSGEILAIGAVRDVCFDGSLLQTAGLTSVPFLELVGLIKDQLEFPLDAERLISALVER